MKFAACVILYNPNISYINNILSYLNDVEICYVVDNSDNGFKLDSKLFSNSKIKYLPQNENKGIAFALNLAAEEACSDGFDFLLTMDQDSSLKENSFLKVKNYIDCNNISKIGQLALNTTEFKKENDAIIKVEEVNYCITSGCFINLENYKKIEGFRKELFIDLVDFDLSYQFKKAGYKIVILKDAYINHEIGEPIKRKVKIFGKTIISSNHSPIRYYYIFRNELFLYMKDKNFYKKIHKNHKKDIWRMLLVEKQKFKKLKMIIMGKRDAKKGKLGKFSK